MKKYKVLFLPTWYPSRIHPTVGNFNQRYAEAISQYADVAVLFIIGDGGMKQPMELIAEMENNTLTVRVYYKKVVSKIPLWSSLVKAYRFWSSFQKGIEEIEKYFQKKPDIVHVHIVIYAGLFALVLKYWKSIPFVITENWSGYLPSDGSYRGFLKKLFTRIIVAHAKAITTVSENLKNAMFSHRLKGRYYVARNVVDTKIFSPPVANNISIKKRILHVSEFDDKAKNISGIIQTVHSLSFKRKDFELHIVGDGPDKFTVEDMCRKFGIHNSVVFFHGLKPIHAVADFMKKSDFFILFSNYDNCPCVLLEAIACGLPVIGTRVGGIPEIISRENGILIEKGNQHELESAINYMIEYHQDYDKRKMFEYAKSHFGYEAIGKQFLEIYQSVV